MRIWSALFTGLIICAAAMPCAHAQNDSASGTAPPPAHPIRNAGAHTGLKSVSAFSLDPVTADEPLIRQASLTVKARKPARQDGFSDAPLPDDDLAAPKERGGEDDARLRADFFHRDHHQVGDALAGGAGANDQRRGHGSMAAGLAVAIPLD